MPRTHCACDSASRWYLCFTLAQWSGCVARRMDVFRCMMGRSREEQASEKPALWATRPGRRPNTLFLFFRAPLFEVTCFAVPESLSVPLVIWDVQFFRRKRQLRSPEGCCAKLVKPQNEFSIPCFFYYSAINLSCIKTQRS